MMGVLSRRAAVCVWLVLVLCDVGAQETPRELVEDALTTICKDTRRHRDGDTFTCVPSLDSREAFVVRFAGVDAPEVGQAYWRASRAKLRELATPGSFVSCYKKDRYGRRVCRLTTADGGDAADLMLEAGLAWYSEAYAHEDPDDVQVRRRSLQADARAAHRGLWAMPDPLEPAACRR